MTVTAPVSQHVVRAAQIRAQIAQREFSHKYAPGHWLPYVDRSFATLPQRVSDLVDAGHPRSAEYWLMSAERFAGCISDAVFQERVTALGTFALEA